MSGLVSVARSIIIFVLTVIALFFTYKIMSGLNKRDMVAGRIFLKEEIFMKMFVGLFLNILFAFVSNVLFALSVNMPLLKEIGRYVADLGLIALLCALFMVYKVIKR